MKQDREGCEVFEVHEQTVRQVEQKMPDERTLARLADLFKLFGDLTRVRILCALFERELCVCDLSALLGMGQSAVSHQLRLLRTGGLVRARREGKQIFYALDDDHVRLIYDQGFAHVTEPEHDREEA